MIVPELLTALFIGVLLVTFFAVILGRRGPWVRGESWGGVLWFFLVVFLAAWAVGTWADPVGPAFWGVAWVPFFFGALAFALLLAALSEPRPTTVIGERPDADAAVGAFTWFLVALFLVIIVIGSI